MESVLQEILSTLVYPAVAATAAAVVKFVLDWSKAKAREALVGAVGRAAAGIALQIGQPVDGTFAVDEARRLADEAEKLLERNFSATIKKLGPVEPGTLSGMVLGELGKIYLKQGK